MVLKVWALPHGITITRNLLEMHIFRPHVRSTVPETLGVEPGNLLEPSDFDTCSSLRTTNTGLRDDKADALYLTHNHKIAAITVLPCSLS